jgi:hypothetical protein
MKLTCYHSELNATEEWSRPFIVIILIKLLGSGVNCQLQYLQTLVIDIKHSKNEGHFHPLHAHLSCSF